MSPPSQRHKPDITLPASYNDLKFTQIQTRHHEKEPSVIILTLYRPANHTAYTDTMREEMEAAYAMFDVDPRVKCIVVTGSGRIFCAGADLGIGFGEGASGADAEKVQDHRDGYVPYKPGWFMDVC
jgi:enoyl-CoA hydratase/carnithine racemase